MELQVHPSAKALIFDLDGTLSDSHPVHLENWHSLGTVFGFRFDERIIYEMTGRPTIDFAKRIIEDNHLSISPVELARMKHQAFWETVHLVRPMKKVVDIVRKYYKVLPMSVGTGASRRSAILQLTGLDLISFFDFIITADDVATHKPEPETFLRCAELMNVRPSECQVFEDGMLGMEAARTAGMMVTDVRPYLTLP